MLSVTRYIVLDYLKFCVIGKLKFWTRCYHCRADSNSIKPLIVKPPSEGNVDVMCPASASDVSLPNLFDSMPLGRFQTAPRNQCQMTNPLT